MTRSVSAMLARTFGLSLVIAFLLSTATACSQVTPTTTQVPAKPTQSASAPVAQSAQPTEASKPVSTPGAAESASVSFSGKTVKIVPGFSPGGQFDNFSRLVAKYLPKYLPGNPTVIVENMPGAGSMLAANYMAKSAPKDGTVIGVFSEEMLVDQIVGVDGIQFDMRKFIWLGSESSATNVCIVRDDGKVKDFNDVMAGKQVVLGTSIMFEYGDVLRKVLGANFKVVSGYAGNADVRLAIEKGEVDGMFAAIEASKTTMDRWAQAGSPKVKIIAQIPHPGAAIKPELKDVPSVWDFAKTPEQTRMIRMLTAGEEFWVPFALAPGTPDGITQVMRKAVQSALSDPDLKSDASKANWALDPVPPERMQAVCEEVLNASDADKAKFREMLKQK